MVGPLADGGITSHALDFAWWVSRRPIACNSGLRRQVWNRQFILGTKQRQFWVATSADVPGLATEADTIEALSQKLRAIVPDLLMSNYVVFADYAGAIAVQLTRHRQELIKVGSPHPVQNKKSGVS